MTCARHYPVAVFATLIPVIALVLGGLLTYLTEARRDSRQRRLTREQSAAERERTLRDRRDTFELEMLIKLSEAMLSFGRAAGRVHHADMMTAKTSGVYGSHQLPEDVSNEMHVAGREVLGLMHFVLDDQVREAVAHAHSSMNGIGALLNVSPEQALRAVTEAMNAHTEAFAMVGARVREIHLRG